MIRNVAAMLACGVSMVAVAPAADAQTRQYQIPAGKLKSALDVYARQSGRQVIYRVDEIRSSRSPGAKGKMSADAALAALLAGTGFLAQNDSSGAVAIVRINATAAASGTPRRAKATGSTSPDGGPSEGVPEILVVADRSWSLNTGIERSRDDSQPFVVFKQEDIKRSGSTNLEQFLRDYVNSNASEASAEQAAPRDRVQGTSTVNLRGLGARETLILIDGRRQPGANLSTGEFGQPLITNIPLASIERIEVLASSAAGIYGIGATGGVINVILRRDYSGRQISFNYADTTDFHNRDLRLDLVLGKNLEGGRTNVSLNVTYRKAEPLLRKHRADFLTDNLRYVLGNNPDFFSSQVPPGATPNIRTSNGSPLRLDPQYGGTVLASNHTFVPAGFRGIALDGVAPLIANVGQYNVDLADSATFNGGNQPLIYGTEHIGGTLAVRREMSSWLRVYGEVAASMYRSEHVDSILNGVRFVAGNAPNNPFVQTIAVRAPIPGADRTIRSKNDQWRVLGGTIFDLFGDWKGVAEIGYSRARFTRSRTFEQLTPASNTALQNGTFDIIQDVSDDSFPFTFDTLLSPPRANGSSILTGTVKLAGSMPVALPGGKPTLALNLEYNREKLDETFEGGIVGSAANIRFNPERRQTIGNAYGEIRLPLIGDANDVVMVQQLELVFAGRYERYKGSGTPLGLTCFDSTTGLPSGTSNIIDLCDRDSVQFQRQTVRSSRFEPTISGKWTISPDIVVRGSFATGYLPPRLNELIPTEGTLLVAATDPERGGETVGTPFISNIAFLPGVFGGNADIKPERSTTLSIGTILTPRFIPGLRASIDYTRVRKRDNYFSPSVLALAAGNPEAQRRFQFFLSLFPERVTRGPASGGFAVGPITRLDLSSVNLAGTLTEAIDLALDYSRPLWGGTIDFSSSASHNLTQQSQIFPEDPVLDFTGSRAVTVFGGIAPFSNTTLKWRGISSLRWSDETASIGVRARYFGPFDLNIEGLVDPDDGRASIPSQTYIDIFGSYRLTKAMTLRGGINNLFSKRPPFIDRSYSENGDPRFANFYLNLTADF